MEFIARLNEFIAVHSRLQEIVSDNASTFKAAAAWINSLTPCLHYSGVNELL